MSYSQQLFGGMPAYLRPPSPGSPGNPPQSSPPRAAASPVNMRSSPVPAPRSRKNTRDRPRTADRPGSAPRGPATSKTGNRSNPTRSRRASSAASRRASTGYAEPGSRAGRKGKSENIHVYVRVRPPHAVSDPGVYGARASDISMVVHDNHTLVERDESNAPGRQFQFEHVFDTDCTNGNIYEIAISDTVTHALEGFNGTVFAFGQTNSGKTHTLTGVRNDPGVTLRAVAHLFEEIKRNQDREFLLRISYFEIYNENVRDLLVQNSNNIPIRESKGKFVIPELSEQIVTSKTQVYQIIVQGEQNRAIGVSNLNEHSSRSHTIFRMIVESAVRKSADGGGLQAKKLGGNVHVSELNIVDLAGSECVSDRFDNSQQKETKHINLSLTQLKTVIQSLSRGDQFTPFRNSALTKVLRNSLGGNARTSVICTVSPVLSCRRQSRMTLLFGELARTIQNKLRINELTDGSQEALILQYREQIDHLNTRLSSLEALEQQKLKIQSDYQKLLSEMEELKTQQAERAALSTELRRVTGNVVTSNSVGHHKELSVNGLTGPVNAEDLEQLHEQLNPEVSVSVVTHGGQGLVVIRETYQTSDGQTRFGSEGIALSLENWRKLKAVVPHIDNDIQKYVNQYQSAKKRSK